MLLSKFDTESLSGGHAEAEDDASGDRIQEALDRFNRFGTWIRLQCTALFVFVAARLDLCPNFVRQNLRLLKNYKRNQSHMPIDDFDDLSLTDSESRWPLRPPSVSVVVGQSSLVRAAAAAAENSLRGSVCVAAAEAASRVRGGSVSASRRGSVCANRQCARGSLSLSGGGGGGGGGARRLSAVRSERDLLADIEEAPSTSAVATVSIAVEMNEQENSSSSQSRRPEDREAHSWLSAGGGVDAACGGAGDVIEKHSNVSFSQSQSQNSIAFDDRAEPDFGWDTDPPIHDVQVVYADDPDDCFPKSVCTIQLYSSVLIKFSVKFRVIKRDKKKYQSDWYQ